MSFSLPPDAQLGELAGRMRDLADDLVSSDGRYAQRLRQRIGDILTPLDSDAQPTHPWQEAYTLLVRTKSPSEYESNLRAELGEALEALGEVHRHTRPEYAPRLRAASKRLARLGSTAAPPTGRAPVTLDPDDLRILTALSVATTTMFQVEIGSKAELSRGTVGPRLKKLRAAGYVSRPNSKRRGDAITDQGLTALKPTQSPT